MGRRSGGWEGELVLFHRKMKIALAIEMPKFHLC